MTRPGLIKGFGLGNRDDSHPKDQPAHFVIGASLHEHCDAASKTAVLTAGNSNDCWSGWTDTSLTLLAMLRNRVPPRPFETGWTGATASGLV